MWLWIIFFLILLYFIFTSVCIVNSNHVVACHGTGYKFTRILKSGINILLPFESATFYKWSDQIYGYQIKLENTIELEPFDCCTMDNKIYSVKYTIDYRVSDPYKAIHSTRNALESTCLQFVRRVRHEVSKYSEILRHEKEISDQCIFDSQEYGISVIRCYMK